MKTPNYILIDEYKFITGNAWEPIILSKGTFVRPISVSYLPKHIIDEYSIEIAKNDILCYTPFGIIPIPGEFIRKLE